MLKVRNVLSWFNMGKRKVDAEHYVDNKEFLKAMKEYRKSVIDAKKKKLPPPRVSDYIGDCLIKIASRLSHRPNFMNYPFREEMVNDGIENCLRYINNFNPNKSKNPFAYFTKIVWYAFLRRIDTEKRHLYTKYKSISQSMTMDIYDQVGDDGHVQAPTKYLNDHSNNYMHEFMENFEKHKGKKKANKKPSTKKEKPNLEKFFSENE